METALARVKKSKLCLRAPLLPKCDFAGSKNQIVVRPPLQTNRALASVSYSDSFLSDQPENRSLADAVAACQPGGRHSVREL
jgi:hypothetical protein